MSKVKQVKVALLALVAALVIAIPTSAFAQTITVQGDAANTSADHNYAAYQIFTGTQDSADSSTLGDIQWGAGIKSNTFVQALAASDVLKTDDIADFNTTMTASQVAAVLQDNDDYSDNSVKMKEFAKIASQNLQTSTTNPISPTTLTKDPDVLKWTATVDPGYYLVKDVPNESVNGTNNSAYTSPILNVVKDVTVTPKSNVPTVTKEVEEDRTNYWGGTSWKDKADYTVGESVPYRLTGTLPENYDTYIWYKYIFHDKMSKGLTYDDGSVAVKVYDKDGNLKSNVGNQGDVTDYFDITWKSDEAGNKEAAENQENYLTVSAKAGSGSPALYLKQIANLAASDKIVVTYTATLNKYANIGDATGNPNDVYLEFSNNPSATSGGDDDTTGKTPKDYCIVFTYANETTKTDNAETNPKVLAGAKFKLQRSVDSKWVKTIDAATNVVTEWTGAEAEAYEFISGNDGKFKAAGLDEGTYVLKEIKAPSGYNTPTGDAALTTFVIGSTLSSSAEYNGTNSKDCVTELKVTIGTKSEDGEQEAGVVTETITNTQGNPLPSTGGIGTTIFYVVGGALVLVALIAMVVRRRRSATTA